MPPNDWPRARAVIRDFRRGLIANGYVAVCVKSESKVPVGAWANGHAMKTLLCPKEPAANTGILCAGMRVIDIDVDDRPRVVAVLAAACRVLGPTPLVRKRSGSTRLALFYRALTGSPAKQSATGQGAKVEILGAGQQVLVHGVHPSGARYEWLRSSPATLPLAKLPSIDAATEELFLAECRHILTPDPITHAGNQVPRGTRPSGFPPAETHLARAFHDWVPEKIEYPAEHWFEELAEAAKDKVVRTCLSAIENQKEDPRERWLSILFAVADAETKGCSNARELAMEWSKRGASWTTEDDFDKAWSSFRSGRVTVGTLFHHAEAAGVVLSRLLADAAATPPAQTSPPPLGIRTFGVSQLPPVPAKRQWLHGTDVLRGAVTLLVAPGARGKSTWLLTLAMACASGRSLLGSTVFGAPLKVLYLNAEDHTNEINLRRVASMQHHRLTVGDLASLRFAGAEELGFCLLKSDRGQALLDGTGWQSLRSTVEHVKPDVLIVDPLVSLMGGVSLNDNAAAALMMGELVRLAVANNMAIVIAHHSSKGRDLHTQDAAMGAASLVNLSRITLTITSPTDQEGLAMGVLPSDLGSVFRVHGAKQNLVKSKGIERLFRFISVTVNNAMPPIYPSGDKVAVVEQLKQLATPAFSAQLISDISALIGAASPPFVPPNIRGGSGTVAAIRSALAARGHTLSDADVHALLSHEISGKRICVADVKVLRKGHGAYERKGLVLAGGPSSPQTP